MTSPFCRDSGGDLRQPNSDHSAKWNPTSQPGVLWDSFRRQAQQTPRNDAEKWIGRD